MDLFQSPLNDCFVLSFHNFWEVEGDFPEVDEGSSEWLFEQLEVGKLIEYLLNCAIIKEDSFVVVNSLDSKLIQAVGVILFSSQAILNSIVPVQVPIL